LSLSEAQLYELLTGSVFAYFRTRSKTPFHEVSGFFLLSAYVH